MLAALRHSYSFAPISPPKVAYLCNLFMEKADAAPKDDGIELPLSILLLADSGICINLFLASSPAAVIIEPLAYERYLGL